MHWHATSLCLTYRFLQLGMEMKVTQGAVKPLIHKTGVQQAWWWGWVSDRSARGGLDAWLWGWGALTSSKLLPSSLTPTFGLGMSAPGLGPPHWWVLSWSYGCLCPLGPAKGDYIHEDEWLQEHLWLWEKGLAESSPSLRPALAMHWLSSCCSSIMHSSCNQQGSSLWVSTYSPWYTCSMMSSISPSVDPRRVLIEGCAGAITLAISIGGAWGHLWVILSLSYYHMAAVLWSR